MEENVEDIAVGIVGTVCKLKLCSQIAVGTAT